MACSFLIIALTMLEKGVRRQARRSNIICNNDLGTVKHIEGNDSSLYQMKVVSSRKKPSTPRYIEDCEIVEVIEYTDQEAS
jgi:hypothetical protein